MVYQLPASASDRYRLHIDRTDTGSSTLTLLTLDGATVATVREVPAAEHKETAAAMVRVGDAHRPDGDPIGECARAAIIVDALGRVLRGAGRVHPDVYPAVIAHLGALLAATRTLTGHLGQGLADEADLAHEAEHEFASTAWQTASTNMAFVESRMRGGTEHNLAAGRAVAQALGGEALEGETGLDAPRRSVVEAGLDLVIVDLGPGIGPDKRDPYAPRVDGTPIGNIGQFAGSRWEGDTPLIIDDPQPPAESGARTAAMGEALQRFAATVWPHTVSETVDVAVPAGELAAPGALAAAVRAALAGMPGPLDRAMAPLAEGALTAAAEATRISGPPPAILRRLAERGLTKLTAGARAPYPLPDERLPSVSVDLPESVFLDIFEAQRRLTERLIAAGQILEGTELKFDVSPIEGTDPMTSDVMRFRISPAPRPVPGMSPAAEAALDAAIEASADAALDEAEGPPLPRECPECESNGVNCLAHRGAQGGAQ